MSCSQWVWREDLSVTVQNGDKPCQNMLLHGWYAGARYLSFTFSGDLTGVSERLPVVVTGAFLYFVHSV
jgi:hypothetical protein